MGGTSSKANHSLAPTPAQEDLPQFAGILPPDLEAHFQITSVACDENGNQIVASTCQTLQAYHGRSRRTGDKVFIKHYEHRQTRKVLTELQCADRLQLLNRVPLVSAIAWSCSQDGQPAAVLTRRSGKPSVYAVFPFVEGGSLWAEINSRLVAQPQHYYPLFEETEVRAILHPLAVAVAALHEQKIAHRDVTCSNIMVRLDTVSGEWCTHLVDFGICRVLDAKSEALRLEYQEADVYAIARVILVMLYGQHGESAAAYSMPVNWQLMYKPNESLVSLLEGCLSEHGWQCHQLLSCKFLNEPELTSNTDALQLLLGNGS